MHLRNRNYYDGSRIRIECTSYDVLLTSSSSCAHPVGGGGHLNVHRERKTNMVRSLRYAPLDGLATT